MSEAKHTPGPFRCDVTDQGSTGREAYVAVIGDDGNFIARVMCHDGRLNELPYKANARLIAAAPEMLEALEHIARLTGSQLPDYARSSHDIARGAIAKATGEYNAVRK